MLDKSVHLVDEQIQQFRAQGFLILEEFLKPELVNRIIDRLNSIFAGQFETGVFSDELHGRPGTSQPNAIRQMTNLWRCDRTIASFSFSAEIARLNATLADWEGSRFATDSCWVRPSGAPETAFHRKNTYVSSINPSSVVTCWIALSDANPEASTLELVPGSHQWICSDKFRFLHEPLKDYRQPLWTAAAEMGIKRPDIVKPTIPPGGCIFVHGNLWHGSGSNTTTDQTHRSFAISTFPMYAQFQPPGVGDGYVFERYRMINKLDMDESFFPILWTHKGYRSPMVGAYCEDALVPSV